MRVVLTGGAGFIGSHLAEALISEGHRVVVVDNLVTGRLENIAGLRSNPNFEFLHHDVSQHLHVAGG
ncbi:MAG: GDP-mannose 4,6-dehydratase, partial [Cyanobacteria bacterium REEB65]|nr:GDP-mannose 4,6-dehydratase [Cyanobacteria bacterium REEB65]